MKIVVGRDKLDEIQVGHSEWNEMVRRYRCMVSLQGVRQKIQAFEIFLDKYPEFQQKVCNQFSRRHYMFNYSRYFRLS